MENVALECQIAVMLRLIGVPAHVKGWDFLVSAVGMAAEDKSIVHGMTKRLYPAVAAKHGTTAAKVERSIRHAIEIAWTNGSMEAQRHYLGNVISAEKGKPTNGAFIAGLASWCRAAA